ncbi:MAG: sialidase family protein [Polyangiaceae bacterium]
MPVAAPSADADADAWPAPPIRLRTVVILALIGLGIWWSTPRATAAWSLHSKASALADYALCMVGPTGPPLLRDNPVEFNKLVRRRLVAAHADERPFEECAKAAVEVTGAVEVERAHRAVAWSFAEYGAFDRDGQPRRGEVSIASLRVTTRPVSELAKNAWPFVRGGYTRLVRPSLNAREAVHPVDLPMPTRGRGLPKWRAWYRAVKQERDGYVVAVGAGANLSVYRSDAAAVDFRPAPLASADGMAGRCGGTEHWFTYALNESGSNVDVISQGIEGSSRPVALARAEAEVFASSCDETTLVAALKLKGRSDVALRLCRHRGACESIELPAFPGVGLRPRYPLDVARVDGVIVVAVVMNGIVRVTSSRDDGRTWTPYVVAFDAMAHPEFRADTPVPGRLLALGKRVMLYGGASKPAHTYPVLFSDDYGASWRSR